MDWKGLLNWSLKYQDGTKPSNLKPMSKEDREFIEKAFEEVVLNEMKEIWKVLDKLKEPEADSKEEIQKRLDLIEYLGVLIDGPENARNIVRGKRFIELIDYFFKTKHKEIQIELARIFTSMLQNDGFIQKAAMDFGLFNFLKLLNESTDKELISIYIYMLTGMLYGDEVEVRKHFVEELNGIVLLSSLLLKQEGNVKNYKRILNIMIDLTKAIDQHVKEGVAELRELTLNKLNEIKGHLFFVDILNKLDYSSRDNIDIIHILIDLIVNVSTLFSNHSKALSVIEDIEKKFKENKKNNVVLNDQEIKDEYLFFEYEKKKIMDEFNQQKASLISILNKENSDGFEIETKKIGNKDSIKIQLKK